MIPFLRIYEIRHISCKKDVEKMKNILKLAIDIGHNVNFDGGAVGIRNENGLNYEVGTKLISKCRAVGITVVDCTPSSAKSLNDSLSQRVITANTNNADFFISIHHNLSPGGQGSEIYSMKGGRGEVVANIILPEIVKIGFKNRGVKDGSHLFVINKTKMPAILIECAFCDSPRDMGNYDSGKMATAIFIGICKAFNVEVSNLETVAVYYTVSKGDTLWIISRKYKTTVDNIVALNKIKDSNLIVVGQKLRII